MVLEQIFYGFSCISMVSIIQNPKIPVTYPILGNIKQNEANFHQKWVPKLKIAISWNHVFIQGMSRNCPKNLKFGQVEVQNGWKKSCLQIFEILIFWPLSGHFLANFCIFGHFDPRWKKWFYTNKNGITCKTRFVPLLGSILNLFK